MNANNAMKSEQRRQIRRAVLAAGVGGALVAGVLLVVPDGDGEPARPPAGPEARAMAAAGAGAPAALPDLTALIRDRERRVKGHPGDRQAWAVLGAAYVERGVRQADAAYYPRAEQALRRSLSVPSGGLVGEGTARSGAGDVAGAAGPGPASPGASSSSSAAPPPAGRVAPRTATAARATALAGLASLANARHDYSAAERWGEEVRKAQPAGWTAYPVLIDAYNGLGEYAAAGKALDRLRKLSSGSPALRRSAEVYRDRGWREDAAAKAAEATARAASPSEKSEALYTQGELAWERGEPVEALGHYDAALEATRDHPASLAGRARALAALGRTEEAITAYQSALRRLPKPEYALELGELYDAQGLNGDAQSQYAWLRDRAETAQAHGVNEELVLARYETDHGDPRAAVERLRAEWARHHRSMQVADALGWALFRTGEAKEALRYASRATDQGMRSALFSYHRAEIERSLGMNGPARRHLDEALRTNPAFSPLLAPKAHEARDALGEPSVTGQDGPYPEGTSASGASGAPARAGASGMSARAE